MSHPLPEGLVAAARVLRAAKLSALFERDAERAQRLTFGWRDFRADLSKERISPEALTALRAHAEAAQLPGWIAAMFAGEKVNQSEGRAALHTALRRRDPAPLQVDGQDIMPGIAAMRARMRALAEALAGGTRVGANGAPIRAVVAIGIGGSDLGPRLVCDALAYAAVPPRLPVHFVSNVDPAQLSRTLRDLEPASTLFIVVSKTFTTAETLANAHSARQWLQRALPNARVTSQFIGVTANASQARAFGIAGSDILPMWDWVGGRYSLWSGAGLPIALAHGMDAFDALCDGAAALDEHFRTAPLAANLPVTLGLLGFWNARLMGHGQRVVVPYAHALQLLPPYLQQLSLESNGKRVTRDGEPVDGATAPALWGSPGTDGQHAYFQWLHQGTQVVPVEFIVPLGSMTPLADQQRMLVANAIAQSQALLTGRAGDAAHACPGDRPSTMLMCDRLDAWHLGALLALWEHRTFVEAVLFGVNPFDQFGVELGKTLALPIAQALAGQIALDAGTDASTRALVAHAAQVAGSAAARD